MPDIVDDIHIKSINKIISPAKLIQNSDYDKKAIKTVLESREQASKILFSKSNSLDDRLLVICGPCSIHDSKLALEYAKLLAEAQDKFKEDLFLIMRVYFEKPRTTTGWKGIINDPDLDESFQIEKGLKIARKLLHDIAMMGVPSGTEFLDTISPQFYADLITWGAIGARTTECQLHRELASGLSMPIGFKNGTGGNYQIAIDAIKSSSQSHRFLSITKEGTCAIVATEGNEDCHIILRGGKNGPNFDENSINEVCDKLRGNNIKPSIMIDCSHANSNKDYTKQPLVSKAIGEQIANGNTFIKAVMIESNLEEGSQKIPANKDDIKYGVSLTDSCVNWNTTMAMLDQLARDVKKRRMSFIA